MPSILAIIKANKIAKTRSAAVAIRPTFRIFVSLASGLKNRMIFFGNNSQPTDPGSSAQFAVRSITTASGTVLANGLVAIVTIDTTGIQSGTFALSMGATVNGASDFAGVSIDITEGSLIVESRPSRIVVGNHALLANTANQQIHLFVTGNDQVSGLNFNLQVADGGPAGGGSILGPVITAVDLVSQPGMVFHGNSTTPVDPGSASRIAIRSLITSSGMVNAEGALAIVTFDTTGIAGGTYPLKMSATVNGDSDFAGIPINIVNGSITIPIPPVPPDILLGVRNVSTGGTMMTEVSFTSASGWDHFIQFQDKLVSATGWQDLPNGPHNTGLLVDSPGARNTRFYRLRIVIQ